MCIRVSVDVLEMKSVSLTPHTRLVGSVHGQRYYNLPPHTRRVRLVRQPWSVPASYAFGSSTVRPLRAGETVAWTMEQI